MSKTVKIEVAKAFKLNIADVLTSYAVGEHYVDESIATHPYTQHFLAEVEAADDTEETDADIAAATSAIILSLVTDEKPVPNVDTINDALKAAGLPQIKAADRDAVLNAAE